MVPIVPDPIRLTQRTRAQFRHLRSDRALILMVRSGAKQVAGTDGRYVAKAGQIGLLPADLPLDIENRPAPDAPYTASALLLPDDLAVPSGPTWIGTIAAPKARAAFDRALDACADPTIPARLRRHHATEVLLWLADAGIALPPKQPPTIAGRCRRLLGNRLDHPWQAAQAAQALAMSEATLRRRLAAEGTTFGELLQDLRMTHALALLQTSDLPINRIALDVGYASPSRFAGRFRDRFGVAPSAIRTGGIDRIRTEAERNGTASKITAV